MKMKIHDVSMKNECCYLIAVVLLTCLLYDTGIVTLLWVEYGQMLAKGFNY